MDGWIAARSFPGEHRSRSFPTGLCHRHDTHALHVRGSTYPPAAQETGLTHPLQHTAVATPLLAATYDVRHPTSVSSIFLWQPKQSCFPDHPEDFSRRTPRKASTCAQVYGDETSQSGKPRARLTSLSHLRTLFTWALSGDRELVALDQTKSTKGGAVAVETENMASQRRSCIRGVVHKEEQTRSTVRSAAYHGRSNLISNRFISQGVSKHTFHQPEPRATAR